MLVTVKTAKLAKEKGFLLDNNPISFTCHSNIEKTSLISLLKSAHENYIVDYFTNPKFNQYYTFPTQTELQKWLREEHKIAIDIKTINSTRMDNFSYDVHFKNDSLKTKNGFNTYEEALEEGLFEALQLIKIYKDK